MRLQQIFPIDDQHTNHNILKLHKHLLNINNKHSAELNLAYILLRNFKNVFV